MRMSENGFYIEKYIKCANCGMLIYGEGIRKAPGPKGLFCTPWCVECAELKDNGVEHPVLPIGQPKLPIEAAYPAKGERVAPLDIVNMNILDSTMVSICRE